MKRHITIKTMNSKIRRKAIRMTAKYYQWDIKTHIIDQIEYMTLTEGEYSIISEDNDMILAQVKAQYMTLTGRIS